MADGAPLSFHKVLDDLPAVPVPDGVYFRRRGNSMSMVVTSETGQPIELAVPGATRFTQVFPISGEWIVNHNLGAKPAAVTVLSSGGVEVEANIVHMSDNQFRVLLNPPMAGQVIVQ